MRRLSHHFLISDRFSFVRLAKLSLAYLTLLAGMSAVLGTVSATPGDDNGAIPPDAIRIRILANSDSSFDQKVKQSVRDRVENEIVSWGPMPGSHDQARALIEAHLDDVQAVADAALAEWGVPYGATVELQKVPFPEKTFEGHAYAAGNYEALRISLGGAEGANWWCVLFPPLCLTAATAPDKPAAATDASGASAKPAAEKVSAKASKDDAVAKTGGPAGAGAGANRATGAQGGGENPQPRFFLAELLSKLGDFLRSIFS